MTLTDALAAALDRVTDPDFGLPLANEETALRIREDPAFREALTGAIFAAFREDMSQPGCGYIDFTWRPQWEGDDSDGGREARAWAAAIVARLLPDASGD